MKGRARAAVVWVTLAAACARGATDGAMWRSLLASELARMDRLGIQTCVQERGVIHVPVTRPMADMFRTVPESDLEAFLRALMGPGREPQARGRARYLELCLRAIRAKSRPGMPYRMRSPGGDARPGEAVDVVDLEIRGEGAP